MDRRLPRRWRESGAHRGVVDQGRPAIVGIDEKDQQSIFEEFRQAEGDMDRNFGGTGLGLSIAKKIVELHGGRIWVESVVGQGTTFYVTLPIVTEIVRPQ